jgi:hypothetical protein
MSIIDLDRNAASDNLHKHAFLLQHKLAEHPLFLLPRLVQLAQELSRDQVEYNHGDLQPGQSAESTPRLDMAPSEVIRNIESCNAWMVLKRVDLVPEYKELLEAFIADLFTAAGLSDQSYSDLEGFIFVSSANSTTPFHADPEENVLAHIKGRKFFHVWESRDGTFISEEGMELSPSNYRNQHYDVAFEEQAQVFDLEPGDALHVPYMSPHWVRTGDEFAISMAMTWKTPEVTRVNKIRFMNGTLRRFGLPQRPPNESPVWDKVKIFVHDCARAILDPIRKTEAARRLVRRLIYGKKANYYY